MVSNANIKLSEDEFQVKGKLGVRSLSETKTAKEEMIAGQSKN